jgi:tetratricopeptide (TPR) repeat protein
MTAAEQFATLGYPDGLEEVAAIPTAPVAGVTTLWRLYEMVLARISQETPQGIRARLHYGAALTVERGDYVAGTQVARDATEAARNIGDLGLEATGRLVMLSSKTVQLDFKDQRDFAAILSDYEDAIAFAQRAGEKRSETRLRIFAGVGYEWMGEIREAHAHLERAVALAHERRDFNDIELAQVALGQLLFNKGDLSKSRALLEWVIKKTPVGYSAVGHLIPVTYLIGNVQEAQEYAERVLKLLSAPGNADIPSQNRAAIGVVTLAGLTGDPSRLSAVKQSMRRVSDDPAVTRYHRASALLALARCAILERDAAAAREIEHSLSDLPVRNFWPWRDLAPGLADVLGRVEDARQSFNTNLEFLRRSGFVTDTALVALEYADFCLRRDLNDGEETAPRLLNEALVIAQKLGMKPLVENIVGRRKILKA